MKPRLSNAYGGYEPPINPRFKPSTQPTPSTKELDEIIDKFADSYDGGFAYVGGSGQAENMRDSFKRNLKQALAAYIEAEVRNGRAELWQEIYDHFASINPQTKMPHTSPKESILIELKELEPTLLSTIKVPLVVGGVLHPTAPQTSAVSLLNDVVQYAKYLQWNTEAGREKAQAIADEIHNGKYGDDRNGLWAQVDSAILELSAGSGRSTHPNQSQIKTKTKEAS